MGGGIAPAESDDQLFKKKKHLASERAKDGCMMIVSFAGSPPILPGPQAEKQSVQLVYGTKPSLTRTPDFGAGVMGMRVCLLIRRRSEDC